MSNLLYYVNIIEENENYCLKSRPFLSFCEQSIRRELSLAIKDLTPIKKKEPLPIEKEEKKPKEEETQKKVNPQKDASDIKVRTEPVEIEPKKNMARVPVIRLASQAGTPDTRVVQKISLSKNSRVSFCDSDSSDDSSTSSGGAPRALSRNSMFNPQRVTLHTHQDAFKTEDFSRLKIQTHISPYVYENSLCPQSKNPSIGYKNPPRNNLKSRFLRLKASSVKTPSLGCNSPTSQIVPPPSESRTTNPESDLKINPVNRKKTMGDINILQTGSFAFPSAKNKCNQSFSFQKPPKEEIKICSDKKVDLKDSKLRNPISFIRKNSRKRSSIFMACADSSPVVQADCNKSASFMSEDDVEKIISRPPIPFPNPAECHFKGSAKNFSVNPVSVSRLRTAAGCKPRLTLCDPKYALNSSRRRAFKNTSQASPAGGGSEILSDLKLQTRVFDSKATQELASRQGQSDSQNPRPKQDTKDEDWNLVPPGSIQDINTLLNTKIGIGLPQKHNAGPKRIRNFNNLKARSNIVNWINRGDLCRTAASRAKSENKKSFTELMEGIDSANLEGNDGESKQDQQWIV